MLDQKKFKTPGDDLSMPAIQAFTHKSNSSVGQQRKIVLKGNLNSQ